MAKKSSKKRSRQRIPKEDRQNLRLWAEGVREQILRPHLDKYAFERDLGWVKERAYLQKVCNEYHARVDWRVEDHEEPELGPYDPEALVEDETLPDDEEILKRARIKLLNKFMRESHAEKIAPVVAERWAEARANNEPGTAGKKEPKAGFRAAVAREVFAALPGEEKAAIAQRAKNEASEAKKAYDAAVK
ncbi:hypothetical protein C8F04DRAFT_1269684 [Mycena alexandri]|uniref:Uncharacterized protein n=1 Tax=Mycena alexandri TaxID=1745969 RepID=A0AAD6WTS8_9AGAR|nr:hypothetical protein C8F04DRAFT_1269684 [Mycena alexandri]